MTFQEIQKKIANSKMVFERRHLLVPRALFVSQDIWMMLAKELGWEDPAIAYPYEVSDQDFDMKVYLVGAKKNFCEAGLLSYVDA
jgi:hypothetical protein